MDQNTNQEATLTDEENLHNIYIATNARYSLGFKEEELGEADAFNKGKQLLLDEDFDLDARNTELNRDVPSGVSSAMSSKKTSRSNSYVDGVNVSNSDDIDAALFRCSNFDDDSDDSDGGSSILEENNISSTTNTDSTETTTSTNTNTNTNEDEGNADTITEKQTVDETTTADLNAGNSNAEKTEEYATLIRKAQGLMLREDVLSSVEVSDPVDSTMGDSVFSEEMTDSTVKEDTPRLPTPVAMPPTPPPRPVVKRVHWAVGTAPPSVSRLALGIVRHEQNTAGVMEYTIQVSYNPNVYNYNIYILNTFGC